MSLKRYLFVIIAVFVLLLSATQLFFINTIQQQISSEVEDKSRALSKQALKLLADTLPSSERIITAQHIGPLPRTKSDTPAWVIRINNTPNKVVDLGEGYEFVTGNQTQTVKIASRVNPPVVEFRERLAGQLQAMHFRPLDDSYAFAVSNNSDGQIAQHIVQFGKHDSAINQYFNWLIGGTLMLTVLGLLLAYWLASHISQPLQTLAKGFVNIEQGHLGSQVTPSGIKEVRDTMLSFNQMSHRLVELSEIEKRFGQQQQMAELGEVARGLAHTLRNPINTIGLAIEQMSHTDMPQNQRIELASQVRQKISHLDNSIKGLLRLTTSDMTRNQTIDLNQVVNDIELEMAMTSNTKIAFSPVQSVEMLGAEVEIRAMIHTLVVNAVEASDEQQTVSVFVSQQNDAVQVQVLDQGTGLDPQIEAQLFKPHITSKPEGAGMGLYIAKRICQLHYHGDIQLSENSPKGCIATLTLANADAEVPLNG
jgi:signal transduction histidine kinase